MGNCICQNNSQLANKSFIAEEFAHEECMICLDEISEYDSEIQKFPVILECGHIFHRRCIQQWKSINHTCPLCRQNFHASNQLSPILMHETDDMTSSSLIDLLQ